MLIRIRPSCVRPEPYWPLGISFLPRSQFDASSLSLKRNLVVDLSIIPERAPVERWQAAPLLLHFLPTMSTTTTTQTITAENVIHLFPDVSSHLASTDHNSTSTDELQGYDEEQIRLMDEVCIVLDSDDNPIGSASKKVCTWPNSHHLSSDTDPLIS